MVRRPMLAATWSGNIGSEFSDAELQGWREGVARSILGPWIPLYHQQSMLVEHGNIAVGASLPRIMRLRPVDLVVPVIGRVEWQPLRVEQHTWNDEALILNTIVSLLSKPAIGKTFLRRQSSMTSPAANRMYISHPINNDFSYPDQPRSPETSRCPSNPPTPKTSKRNTSRAPTPKR